MIAPSVNVILADDPPADDIAACRGTIVGPGINEPDPYPGYGGFVGWESPVRLRDGTWLVGFSAGYWHASPPTPLRYPAETLAEYEKMGMPVGIEAPTGGRAMIVRSADAGRTWSRPRLLIDSPDDDRHPSLLELPDGTLLCCLFTYTSDSDSAARIGTLRSFDGGQTWEEGLCRPQTPFIVDETNGPMLLMPDGSVLMAADGQREPGGLWEVGIYRTDDGGDSWHCIATIAADHDLYEPGIARLPAGRLVLIARPEGVVSWSDDEGRTWTKPAAFGMRLFAPSLYALRDGTLVCLHGSYAKDHGGLRAIFSHDGGQTWSAPAADHGFLVDRAYGYGKAMELDDGSLYITYLSTGGHRAEDARTNAVWCIRLRVRDDRLGIEHLPAPSRV